MREDGKFLEWAEIYGSLYGTPLEPIQEATSKGIDVALAIDVQGAREINCQYSHAVFVFIMPPSLEELERRLKGRGSEQDRSLSTRLENAGKEISTVNEYDYIIINHHFEESVTEMQAVITAERLKRNRYIINTE